METSDLTRERQPLRPLFPINSRSGIVLSETSCSKLGLGRGSVENYPRFQHGSCLGESNASSESRSGLILSDLPTNRVQIPDFSDIRQACKRELGGAIPYHADSTELGNWRPIKIQLMSNCSS